MFKKIFVVALSAALLAGCSDRHPAYNETKDIFSYMWENSNEEWKTWVCLQAKTMEGGYLGAADELVPSGDRESYSVDAVADFLEEECNK